MSAATLPAKSPSNNGAHAAAPAASVTTREIEFVPFMSKDPIKLSVATIIGYLAKPTKSGKACTTEQAVRFMMLCKARGLNPWEGDAFLVGFDTKDGPEFNLITAHQAFLKRAEVHPQYDGMESGVTVRLDSDKSLVDMQGDFVDEGQTIVGGWARVHLKERSVPMYKRLKLSSYNKGFGVWQTNAAGMIVKCAEADALRSAFPNSLGGMYLAEEFTPMQSAAAAEVLPAVRMDLRKPAPAPQSLAESAQGEVIDASYTVEPEPVRTMTAAEESDAAMAAEAAAEQSAKPRGKKAADMFDGPSTAGPGSQRM